MSKMSILLSCLAIGVIAVGLSGCSGAGESDQAQPAPSQPSGGGADDHAGHDHADPTIAEAFAGLSDEDHELAEAQKICPVSGQPLGSMGTPLKVTVTAGDGSQRDVFLCCAGCEGAIKGDPDTYLAKLDE